MKPVSKWIFFAGLLVAPFISFSQDEADSTGLPGDNFDLQGALELFKNAASPEAFEKALNTQSNDVNNLDLNSDNKTDYIHVIDQAEGHNHAILMRVDINATERQDVAVIVLEQTSDSTAQVQIVGNETLYGEEKVVEPYDEVAEKATVGPSSIMSPMRIVIVNAWGWPCVRYMYRPAYVIYMSPWGWEMYPVWWSPWQPVWWHTHYWHAWRYHRMRYQYTPSCYMHHSHAIYMKHRANSTTVTQKYAAPRANYQAHRKNVNSSNRSTSPASRAAQPNTRGTGKPTSTSRSGQVEKKEMPVSRQSGTIQRNSNGNAGRTPRQHTNGTIQRNPQHTVSPQRPVGRPNGNAAPRRSAPVSVPRGGRVGGGRQMHR